MVLCILISPLFNEDKREDSNTEAIVENNLSNSTEAKRGKIPKSEVSSDEITIRNGHNGTDIGKYRILSEPIRDCIGFTILIESTCENPDDNIDVCRAYVRELSGNWVEIGEIDVIGWSGVTDGPATGGCTFSFKDAISFDAYACLSGSSESNTDYTSGSRLSKLVYAQ